MIRKIIHIDEEKCNGCGACAAACHEGAIQMVDGKARLTREDYCDGLGDCLPACPTGAITFEEREAPAYNEAAVLAAKASGGGCPGSRARALAHPAASQAAPEASPSCLAQWPVQLRLVPVKAPYLDGADLLLAADCSAYAYGNFHRDFISGRVTLVACPKLDPVDYREKLAEMFRQNDIRSICVVRMEVPCCGGLEFYVKEALQASGKSIPYQVVTLSTEGAIL